MTMHSIKRAPSAPAPSVEELAAEVVRLGREAAREAHDWGVGTSVREWRAIGQRLGALGERCPFDADEEALTATLGALGRAIEAEEAGTERRVTGYDVDEDGRRCDVLGEVPVHTERGERLIAIRAKLEAFVRLRDQVLDRLAAERALEALRRA